MEPVRYAHEIYRRPPKRATRLFLSDDAFEGLLKQAASAGYRHPQSTTAKGLARYLSMIFSHPHQVFQDTRPPHYKEGDPILLDPNHLKPRLPKWLPDTTESMNPRKMRGLRGELPLDAIYEVGLHRGITAERLAHSSNALERATVISATVEALGLGYLTPTIVPQSEIEHRTNLHRPREIAW